MRFRLFILCVFCVFLGYAGPVDWGRTGHRVVGEIAVAHLSKKAKKKINELLQGQGLAMAATFADDIKSDPAYQSYGPWHYVNFEYGQAYDADPTNAMGDLVQGIRQCINGLQETATQQKEQVFYLKMLIHLIGDLHQPLHVGRKSDRGGNDIPVTWFAEASNLHRVWDSQILAYDGMSYTELADNRQPLTPSQKAHWQEGTLMDWVLESQMLAQKVYASAANGDTLSYEYAYLHLPLVREQLHKAGIRLAIILNQIFD